MPEEIIITELCETKDDNEFVEGLNCVLRIEPGFKKIVSDRINQIRDNHLYTIASRIFLRIGKPEEGSGGKKVQLNNKIPEGTRLKF